MKHSSSRSSNSMPQQRSRGSSAWARLFSMQTLLRAVGGLLVTSAVMNILYHSQLPTPRNDLIYAAGSVQDLSHSTASSTITPLSSLPSSNTNSTVVSETGQNDHTSTASGNPQESSFQATPPLPSSNSSIVWGSGAKAQQVVKKDKKGNVLHRSITQIKKEDLVGIGDDKVLVAGSEETSNNLSLEEVKKGREELLAILQDAGVQDIDAASIAKLPTWSQVRALYGDKPVVYGLETCERFRNNIPKDDASVATAGLFNTGTNP
jgi:hypothetical protein